MASGPRKNNTVELPLESLAQGFQNIPPAAGMMMTEAAVVCLDDQGHKAGVELTVEGSFTHSFALTWSIAVTDPMRRFWNDLEEATEQGAYAVAIVLLRAPTGFTIMERSRKGSGFDWWLGNDDNLFQNKARLEVSGILKGSSKRVNSRLRAREKQIGQSDELALTAYVVVVEFGTPRAKVIER